MWFPGGPSRGGSQRHRGDRISRERPGRRGVDRGQALPPSGGSTESHRAWAWSWRRRRRIQSRSFASTPWRRSSGLVGRRVAEDRLAPVIVSSGRRAVGIDASGAPGRRATRFSRAATSVRVTEIHWSPSTWLRRHSARGRYCSKKEYPLCPTCPCSTPCRWDLQCSRSDAARRRRPQQNAR